MTRRNSDSIEQAESHRTGVFGMMARWPEGTKGVIGPASHDKINRITKPPHSSQSGLSGAWREDRVRIKKGVVLARHIRQNTINIKWIMH